MAEVAQRKHLGTILHDLCARAVGSPMRILAFLTDPPVVRCILLHLDLSPCPHPPCRRHAPLPRVTSSSTSPPRVQAEPARTFDLGQSGPEVEFDRSLPDSLDG